jgi:uncharacterized protein YerC
VGKGCPCGAVGVSAAMVPRVNRSVNYIKSNFSIYKIERWT